MWSDYANYSTSISVIQLKNILCVVAIILLLKYTIAKFRREPRFVNFARTLPGPYALPIFGNSLNFILHAKDDPIVLQKEYVRTYGPTYRMWTGKHLHVVLSDVEDLNVAFQSSKILGKSRTFIEPFQKFWGDGLFTTNSVRQWKADRKRLQPFFTNDRIIPEISTINDAIYRFIELIEKKANRAEFDIGNYIFSLSYDIITRVMFDYETHFEDKSVKDLQTTSDISTTILTLKIFAPILNSKLIDYFLYTFYLNSMKNNLLNNVKKVKLVIEWLNEGISKKFSQIEKGLNTSEKSTKPFLWASFKMLQETGNEKKMLEELLMVQIAGTATTSVTTSFALLMIAMHPDIQEKLYAEIYDVFGDADRPASYEDIANLTYLDQVVKETQRRYTLVPSIFREVEDDVKIEFIIEKKNLCLVHIYLRMSIPNTQLSTMGVSIGSRVFPAGTGLMIHIGFIHFNPKFYPEPFEFNPDNFNSEAVKNRPKYSFIPFSAGPRNCLGKNMAEIEIRLIIVAILRKFSLRTSMTMENLKIGFGFSIRSVNGYPLSIKYRNLSNQSVKNIN